MNVDRRFARDGVMIRPAFVDDFFDAIAVTLDCADGARVERRALRKVAQHFGQLRSQFSAALFDGGRRFQSFGHGGSARFVLASYFSQ